MPGGLVSSLLARGPILTPGLWGERKRMGQICGSGSRPRY